MLYLAGGERFAVIGSNAGNERTPARALNLRADPHVEVQVGDRRQKMRAQVSEGEERRELWGRMNDQ